MLYRDVENGRQVIKFAKIGWEDCYLTFLKVLNLVIELNVKKRYFFIWNGSYFNLKIYYVIFLIKYLFYFVNTIKLILNYFKPIENML